MSQEKRQYEKQDDMTINYQQRATENNKKSDTPNMI